MYWFYGIELSQLFLSDGQYFVAGDPFNLVPKFGYLCTGGGVCYSPNQQRDISFQATGAYYIVLVSGQWCHIWMCKTRRMSVFSHGLLRNHTMLMAVCVEFAIMMLVRVGGKGVVLFCQRFDHVDAHRWWRCLV